MACSGEVGQILAGNEKWHGEQTFSRNPLEVFLKCVNEIAGYLLAAHWKIAEYHYNVGIVFFFSLQFEVITMVTGGGG